MKKQSAGILLYRTNNATVEVFLVHPGGPFWAKKDKAAWSIPKGEYGPDEDPEAAARREFQEETGMAVPVGTLVDLGTYKVTSNKEAHFWYQEGQLNPKHVKSIMMSMEWPPRSGKQQEFPEVDKADWFPLAAAKEKIVKGQMQVLETLAERLGADVDDMPNDVSAKDLGQTSLF